MHSHTKFWSLDRASRRDLLGSFVACAVAQAGQGPTMASIGPLAFGPDGTLFAADNQGAAIVALDLGAQATAAPGAKGLDALDEKLAALLGTGRARSPSPISRFTRERTMPTCRRCAARAQAPHRRSSASMAPARSTCRVVAEVPERRAAEPACGQRAGPSESPREGGHRHGVRGRPPLGGRALE